MKNGIKAFLVTVIFVSAAGFGCASNNVRSAYDPDVDFGSYTTYQFYEDAGIGNGRYQSFFAQYMMDAIVIEMDKRGYTRSNNPDLFVNFNGVLEEKTQVTTTPVTMGGYYGYRRGYYSAWPSYGYATETRVSEYTEGTFNIDLVDAKRGRLVWEAVGQGRVSQSDLANLEERVNVGVPRYFASFPFIAGNSNPVK